MATDRSRARGVCQTKRRGMIKRTITTTVIACLLSASIGAGVEARGAFHGLVMSPGWYKKLAQCETGKTRDGKLNWNHETKTYTSGFGIAKGTWRRWSNSSSAKGKSPRYQAEVVDNIAWHGHMEPSGFVWPVGPWGWAVVKSNCMRLKDEVCRSRHPKVQKWKKGKGRCYP